MPAYQWKDVQSIYLNLARRFKCLLVLSPTLCKWKGQLLDLSKSRGRVRTGSNLPPPLGNQCPYGYPWRPTGSFRVMKYTVNCVSINSGSNTPYLSHLHGLQFVLFRTQSLRSKTRRSLPVTLRQILRKSRSSSPTGKTPKKRYALLPVLSDCFDWLINYHYKVISSVTGGCFKMKKNGYYSNISLHSSTFSWHQPLDWPTFSTKA